MFRPPDDSLWFISQLSRGALRSGASADSRELFLARMHPEDRAVVDEAIDQALAGSQSFEIGYCLLRPEGETRCSRMVVTCETARSRHRAPRRGDDVTSQVRANLDLRLHREEIASLDSDCVDGQIDRFARARAQSTAHRDREQRRGQPKVSRERLLSIPKGSGDFGRRFSRRATRGRGYPRDSSLRRKDEGNRCAVAPFGLVRSSCHGRDRVGGKPFHRGGGSGAALAGAFELIRNSLEAMQKCLPRSAGFDFHEGRRRFRWKRACATGTGRCRKSRVRPKPGSCKINRPNGAAERKALLG